MPLAMTWWMWLLLGMLLMALEAVTPGGFFIFFFGVGALAVGIAEVAGVPMSLPVQVLLFVVMSVVPLLLFRKPLREHFASARTGHAVDSLIGEVAQALDEIPAGGIGKVELRGTSWSAQNLGAVPIPRSSRCRVERVEGLTLHVRC
jgi:membrane protein implicated in regulation of membrane protease activity